MISQKEFYELYNKNSKRNISRNSGPIDARLFLRNLSLPIAYLLAKNNVSANAVTVVFLLIALAGNFLLVIPSVFTIILLIIFHEVAWLFDCVDGQLARYHGTFSKYGENFDTLSHVIVSGTFMLAFGTRIYLESGQAMFLLLGGIGAFAKAFEQQLEISKKSISESPKVKSMYYHSKIRKYIVYGVQTIITEIRIFSIVVLILTLIQPNTIRINFVELSFIAMVLVVFLESFVYKIYLSIKQLGFVERKVWKGW
ncbi:hypothetical protein A3I53_04530 [Candidatus Curtissbacteria bacterium RIFCSPLOWO2_02_FULL_40_13b]|uniref:CDP-alcohol phosphatidyltransferase n=1 Tax=Candidatus Curtissbacteria bacterium RIFCSPLOWO2_02_FULL_40_13b TaxID=1797733 RepID=A0A1F5HUT7_9BACT|nr:MAG: hypothetical protein A3I53_04530 [Candidatus Curtissbacteria bacterium RIFCSPLOWO2_02_FULL_40_13b]